MDCEYIVEMNSQLHLPEHESFPHKYLQLAISYRPKQYCVVFSTISDILYICLYYVNVKHWNVFVCFRVCHSSLNSFELKGNVLFENWEQMITHKLFWTLPYRLGKSYCPSLLNEWNCPSLVSDVNNNWFRVKSIFIAALEMDAHKPFDH